MSDVADVATIEEIAAREAKQIINRLETEIADLKQEVRTLAAALRGATTTVTTMIEALSDPTNRPPVPILRPPAVDKACAAAPGEGPQRITVDVFGRQLTEDVQPGSDPAQVWADMCTAVSVHAQREAEAWQN